MTTHRFAALLTDVGPVNRLPETSAFVPCPLFQNFSADQQERIQAIYQIAAERTREQMKPVRYPQFSMN